MNRELHYWWTTMLRGAVALFAGNAILVIPGMARTLLLRPLAIAIAILGLAVYGVIDSILIFVSSYMLRSPAARIALRLQGFVGAIVGVVLYVVFFDQVLLRWFLLIIVLHSLSTALGEFLVAHHSPTHATSRWNYAASAVALGFSVLYLYLYFGPGSRMLYADLSRFVFGYLLTFGIAQCLTAGRMLYADVRSHHEVAANL